MLSNYGPKTSIAKEVLQTKYRNEGESFEEGINRFAAALTDTTEEYHTLRDILLEQRFMGGGRTQLAVGNTLQTTAFNCYVSNDIEDSFDSIMQVAAEAGVTMRMGGGIGYDFSQLRPRGALIRSLGSRSSGPISFMGIYDAICQTVASAGHRRGAQMGVLRVDHPDIEEFITAKQNQTNLTAFNISIGVTDAFMEAVINNQPFDLVFEGQVYKTISASNLWEKIMRSTWDWAEPGVLFIDRINEMNNLYYCETIKATNPCGEQPLPANGACLLGSFNLVKYLMLSKDGSFEFNYKQLVRDIPTIVRAMDRIHDVSLFPLHSQKVESENKRRMGIGVTGLANAVEALGCRYGDAQFIKHAENIFATLRDVAYRSSMELAREKGAFPMCDSAKLSQSKFIKTLPKSLQRDIEKYGLRNSHILSFAPTGTISLTADNVSGGIEPVFSHAYNRTINTEEGTIVEEVKDWAFRELGIRGKTANECTATEHLNVLSLATKYVDSSVSKTINVSPTMPWNEFKDIYMKAWQLGCKGCTTFNSGGKRFGILNEKEEKVEACFIDPTTGQKECS